MSSQAESNINNSAAFTPPLEISQKDRTVVSIKLNNPFHQNFFPYLMNKLQKDAADIKHSPIVLDCAAIQGEAQAVPFKALIHGFKAHSLFPIAVENATEEQYQMALAAGLPNWVELSADNTQTAPTEDKPTTLSGFSETMIIHEPIRSGKQIYAENADLIILAPVSAGAEVVADGNIHIYSQLNGKALAGFKGNTKSRIFCTHLNAELISIAGIYHINEDISQSFFKKNVQIFIEDENLKLEIIK